MGRRRERRDLTPGETRMSYLIHASYYFYKAHTADENFFSALNRVLKGRARAEALSPRRVWFINCRDG